MKKYFVKLISRLLHRMMHEVIRYFLVFIVNPFSLLWSIFFSRRLCFLWFPCVLLISESISLDTSGKPTVGFFLKITSPSWIISSISLDALNLIWLIVEGLMMNFPEIFFILLLQKNFNMKKIYMRFFGEFTWILFFGISLLMLTFQWFEIWILLWVLPWNIVASKP